MPQPARQGGQATCIQQSRPVRTRKIKQKGYEFEVLSKVHHQDHPDQSYRSLALDAPREAGEQRRKPCRPNRRPLAPEQVTPPLPPPPPPPEDSSKSARELRAQKRQRRTQNERERPARDDSAESNDTIDTIEEYSQHNKTSEENRTPRRDAADNETPGSAETRVEITTPARKEGTSPEGPWSTSPFVRAIQRRLSMEYSLDRSHHPAASTERQHGSAANPKENGSTTRPSTPTVYANVEDGLPDPLLKHVGWVSQDGAWSQAREKELRRRIGGWASSAARAGHGNDAELWMWRLMIHFFGAMPHELFRYGLRPDRDDCLATTTTTTTTMTTTGPGDGPRAYNPSYEFCLELAVLMCHPVWEGDLAKMRYALQLAVCSRVSDHEPPVTGVTAEAAAATRRITDAAAKACRDLTPEAELELMCGIQAQTYLCGGVQTDRDVRWLAGRMATARVPDRHAAGSEEERLLFMLRTADVAALREALDAQQSHGQAKWRASVEYCRGFAETPAGEVLTGKANTGGAGVAAPADHATLSRWKTECFVSERRERIIRDGAGSSGALLFDIGRADPEPYHIFGGDFSEAQQRVVNGLIDLPPDHSTNK